MQFDPELQEIQFSLQSTQALPLSYFPSAHSQCIPDGVKYEDSQVKHEVKLQLWHGEAQL